MSIFTRRPRAQEIAVIEHDSDSVDEAMRERHRELAKFHSIGCAAPAETGKLRNMLVELGVRIYDRAQVEKWMDKQGQWNWKPLRPTDRRNLTIHRLTPNDYSIIYGGMSSSIYSDLVPLPVLETMDQVYQAMPNKVAFYVGSLDKHPDPFLAVVSLEDNSVFVIERWDEPGYRER